MRIPPEDNLIVYTRFLMIDIPELLRTKTFYRGLIMPEVIASFASNKLKILVLVRRPMSEDYEDSAKIARKIKEFKREGYLCICVFPEFIKRPRPIVLRKLRRVVLAHLAK